MSFDVFNFIQDEQLRERFINTLKCIATISGLKEEDMIQDAIEKGVLTLSKDDLLICGFDEELISKLVEASPENQKIRFEEDVLTVPLIAKPEKKKKREKKEKEEKKEERKEKVVKVAIRPPKFPKELERISPIPEEERVKEEDLFSFVKLESLRRIILDIINNRGTSVEEEHKIALGTGAFVATVDEWKKVASLEDLKQYQLLKVLDVLHGEVIVPTALPRDIIITPGRIGESIRNWLLLNKDEGGSPYEFYKLWRTYKYKTSYPEVTRIFHILETLGLIEKVNEKKYTYFNQVYRGEAAKIFYRIVKGKEADPRFLSAQKELYPAAALGKRYNELSEEERRLGRNKQYIK